MSRYHKLILIVTIVVVGLSSATFASAASDVFYSVGDSIADLKSGTPNVTITGGVATFDVAQTKNIGVGDKVIANAISYYISAKTSTTVWNVVTVTGATPGNIGSTAVTSIKHVYTSLNSAVLGAGTLLGNFNLITANVVLNIPCYYDSAADTAAVTVSGYTTDATRYIKIYTPSNTATEANNSQRAMGKWDAGKYSLQVSGLADLNIGVKVVYVDGVQLYTNGSGCDNAGLWLASQPANWYVSISNSILKGSVAGVYWHYGVEIYNTNATGRLDAKNNIFYNWKSGNGGAGIRSETTGATLVINAYNNTFYNADNALNSATGNIFTASNNIFAKCIDQWNCITGTFTASSTNNASDNPDSPDGASNSFINRTFTFVSTASGTEDFHLAPSDTAAKNAGADLSADTNLAFTTDIDGETRHAGVWDIGADENNSVNIQFNRNVQFNRGVTIK